jgi:hypothetical protein
MNAPKNFKVVLAAVAAALAATLAIASPARAVSPTRDDIGTVPYNFTVDCSPYGFDFANVVQGVETLFVETFYDQNGNPVKVVVHDGFTETDTNSVTGKTLPLSQTWVNTFDLVAGTRTVVGKAFVMTDPQRGIVIQDTGRVIFDAPEHVSFEAGQHDPLHGNLDQLACSALAAT